jgi:hypothetical protein
MLAMIYTLALGLIVCAFVEIGLYTFLKEPESPWPDGYEPAETYEEKQKLAERQNIYNEAIQRRNGIVTVLSLVFATALLAISLLTSARLGVLSNGILLGGVFTLLYGVGLGIRTGGRILRFVVATISLVVALALGYIKFVPHS